MTTQEEIKEAQQRLADLRTEYKADEGKRKEAKVAAIKIRNEIIEAQGKVVLNALKICYEWRKLGKSKKLDYQLAKKMIDLFDNE